MAPVADSTAGVIVTGDLNAPPGESTHTVFTGAGYMSASKVGSAEPACAERLLESHCGPWLQQQCVYVAHWRRHAVLTGTGFMSASKVRGVRNVE